MAEICGNFFSWGGGGGGFNRTFSPPASSRPQNIFVNVGRSTPMHKCADRCIPEKNTMSGAQKNDMNATCCFAGNSSFKWHPLRLTHRQFIICVFYFSKFHIKPDFVFKYNILQFCSQCYRDFKLWEFLLFTSFCWELGARIAFTLSGFLPGVRVPIGHPTISK